MISEAEANVYDRVVATQNFVSLPCIHRGDEVGGETCRLCGSRGKIIPVHACDLFGTCTERKWRVGTSRHAVCLTCAKREPPKTELNINASPGGMAAETAVA